MKLKNVLCMAVVSAAVTLTGAPLCGAPLTVQAEESQFANLDAILRQMYAYYTAGDYASMYTLDVSDATVNYVDMITNSGLDRYVIDLDGNTKAMLYVSPDGGWYWYFGQMTNNLRQGNGTTIILGSSYTKMFTGNYNADYPNGTGTLSMIFNNSAVYTISGNFQGTSLNGTYQVNVNWMDDYGVSCASSLPLTYANNHLQSVSGWSVELTPYPENGYTEYYFWNTDADLFFDVDAGIEIFAVGLSADEWSGRYWGLTTESLSNGLDIFSGNSAVPVPSTPVPTVPTTPDPAVTTPTPTTTPQPTTVPGTYTVQRGDNLSKIAQKVYGDQKLWKKIYEANSNIIKSDYIIWANEVLVIPAL